MQYLCLHLAPPEWLTNSCVSAPFLLTCDAEVNHCRQDTGTPRLQSESVCSYLLPCLTAQEHYHGLLASVCFANFQYVRRLHKQAIGTHLTRIVRPSQHAMQQSPHQSSGPTHSYTPVVGGLGALALVQHIGIHDVLAQQHLALPPQREPEPRAGPPRLPARSPHHPAHHKHKSASM